MMAATAQPESLIDRLPRVRGRLSAGADLGRVTWFQVGGPAEVLFKPEDTEDLSLFLKDRPRDVPVTIIGVGSNLLVRDGGIPGVVVRLGRAFATIDHREGGITCGAAALDVNVARVAGDVGIAGLEFLSGVPGSIGGALRMNAGAYGKAMNDIVTGATALDDAGRRHELSADDLGFGYRQCKVPQDWIFVEAHLRGEAGNPADIQARMADIKSEREGTQPVRTNTGGSTFKNPDDGIKAWQLIDEAGCRGLRHGGAQISEQHCNFIINDGAATAADIEALGEDVRARVKATSGVELEWEIKRIGVPAGGAS